MKSLRLHWSPSHGAWLLDCPAAPTPAQAAWLKAWLVAPKQVDHLLTCVADPAHRAAALQAAIDGRVEFNVLGSRMNGTGDIKLFEAPKPRERIYSGV